MAPGLRAADDFPANAPPPGYVADLRAHTPEELADLLWRVSDLAGSADGFPSADPVIFVLHGDESAAFTRANYRRYKDVVDLAAQLEAFGLVDIRICEQWLTDHGLMQSDLPPFVDTVPSGPAEAMRLEREGYVSF